MLQETKFGWVVVGPNFNNEHINTKEINLNYASFQKAADINSTLEKFWQIEECKSTPSQKPQDECEILFTEMTKRDETGRFIVPLPFKEDPSKLGDSYKIALKRLFILERKLKENEKLRSMYKDFLKEYEDLGHMTKIDPKRKFEFPAYYIPHLGVLDESRVTTKLRVVFDASSPTTSNKSLNSILRTGPNIQDTLFSILLRFREYPIVLTADATKMYRQVWIAPEHRKFQRILWREDDTKPISIYELNTVTYGTAPASFLAIRALREAALLHKDIYPKASELILTSFYVDDFLGGGWTQEEVIEIKEQVEKILQTAGFLLRKWSSNDQTIFKDQNQKDEPFYFSSSEETKVLGMQWKHQEDQFLFKSSLTSKTSKYTKRSVLSESSKLFDPLGLVSPIVVRAKFILQKIWQNKSLNWDDELPMSIIKEWSILRAEFINTNTLKAPRHLNISTPNDKIILHGFSDASIKGYGSCIYAVNMSNNPPTSILVCSKSRVAPMKTLTLPKLELCAARLLSELMTNVTSSMKHKPSEVHLWSDSCIVLCWIQTTPEKLQTFVSNRVSEIQQETRKINGSWHYVQSKENPADLISRGTSVNNLRNSKLWWHGPSWLLKDATFWPKAPMKIPKILPELKPNKIMLMPLFSIPLSIMQKGTLYKTLRIVARCLRFIKNTRIPNKTKHQRESGYLKQYELNSSLIVCVKAIQNECFPEEMKNLNQNSTIHKQSSIKSLHPFIDKKGILRVGGRLHNSNLNEESKYPILLPYKHNFTKMVFEEEHLRLGHAPPMFLLSMVRERFWTVKGPIIAKKIVNKCVSCRKANPRFHSQIMGPLPANRVTSSPVFSIVSLDYAGPIYVKSKNTTDDTLIKTYVCVFTCMSTKSVHLELAIDLTVIAFLNVFKRFTSRRGIPQNIYSDNARTFVGSNKVLTDNFNKIIKSPEVARYFESCQIEWKFQPPYSPHFGGLHEAAIKSFKRHFRILTKSYTFTYEEAETITVQIEAILNSRPITSLSSDPHDLTALTPGHFLIGRPLMSLPTNITFSHRRQIDTHPSIHWKHLNNFIQQFWIRWNREYLQQLQRSSKWHESNDKFQKGSIVILREKNIPSTCWKLARIVKLHYGTDGKARVASLRTLNGIVTRAITEIALLPVKPLN